MINHFYEMLQNNFYFLLVKSLSLVDNQIKICLRKLMEGHYKSPISSKSINRSRANLSKSVNVAKHSQYKQQSESKNHLVKCKQVADRQTYKNILNKLLRIPNLTKFVREAEQYVDLTEEIIGPFKTSSQENNKRRLQLLQYGQTLLRDGSFLRYYCKLVEKHFPQRKNEIRSLFFQKYRQNIYLRVKMFEDYFKEQHMKEFDLNSHSFSKPKQNLEPNSILRLKKKAYSEINEPKIELDKDIENHTVIQFNDTKSCSSASENFPLMKSNLKKNSKKVHQDKLKVRFQQLSEKEEKLDYEDDYKSPEYTLSNFGRVPQLNNSGSRKKTSSKNNSNRKVILFEDDIKNNVQLQQIMNQIKKQKEKREQNVQNSQKKPVQRNQIDQFYKNTEIKRFRSINEAQRVQMPLAYKQILKKYSSIHLIAHPKGTTVGVSKIEGTYGNLLIKKAYLTDLFQQECLGIIVTPLIDDKEPYQPCIFEEDDRLQVILFL